MKNTWKWIVGGGIVAVIVVTTVLANPQFQKGYFLGSARLSKMCKVLFNSGSAETKLNVIFVPTHYYKDLGKFKTDASLLMEALLSFPFYSERKHLMNFFYVAKTSTTDGCDVDVISGTPNCGNDLDHSGVEKLAGFCGYDKTRNDQIIAVFDNTIIPSYARGQNDLVTIGSDKLSIIAHEFSHAFGRLGDTYYGDWENGVDPSYPNCASDTPGYTCQDKWGDLIGTGEGDNQVGCYQNCHARNWYRPTLGGDLMNSADLNFFDPVSLRHMETLFERYK